jgi:hypothetical protein
LPQKLQVLRKNVEAIEKAEAPKTKIQVRSFLGLCGVYRRFVPEYATIAKPLTALTKKGAHERFDLTEDQQMAFEKLRKSLVSRPHSRCQGRGDSTTLTQMLRISRSDVSCNRRTTRVNCILYVTGRGSSTPRKLTTLLRKKSL